MTVRALGLLSGGLDSSLAALMIRAQGIEVEGLYFNTGFCLVEARQRVCRRNAPPPVHHGEEFSKAFDIPMRIVDIRDEYLEVLKNPKHGYGSAFNPCIDCRIFMFRKARAVMLEERHDFIFTGEVSGQRPMTQMPRMLKHIEKASGLWGLIVRPLSAKLLPPTIPEQEGKVNREMLLDIHGRRRAVQMDLAEKYGLREFPTPSGGCCFLTDPHLKWRFKDLLQFKSKPNITYREFYILKYGRHFRLSPQAKLIAGRDEPENEYLMANAEGFVVLKPESHPGPLGLLEPAADEAALATALRLMASYCTKDAGEPVEFTLFHPDGSHTTRAALPDAGAPDRYRIAKENAWTRKSS
jgi:tRNA U34 2-thiouridine synthase MnmA/TrmU